MHLSLLLSIGCGMNGKSRTVEKDIKLDLLFLTGIVKYKDSQLVC